MGFFAPLVAGLGSLFKGKAIAAGAKTVLGAVAGGKINSYFDSKKQRDSYDFMASKGLTPQEIAGSGAAGQGSTGVGNVLGNQAAELTRISRQQAYDEKQRNLDRQIALRGQDTQLATAKTSAGATLGAASLAAGTARDRLSLDRDSFQNVTLPRALREAVTEAPQWKRMQILAGMGVDNILGTSVAQQFGINPMDPRAVRSMSQAQFMDMARLIYGMQSRAFGETSGGAMSVAGAFDGFRRGVSVLGSSSVSPSSQGRNR